MIYKTRKDKHIFNPAGRFPMPIFGDFTIAFSVIFYPSFTYSLDKGDQFDWAVKLGGFSDNWLRNDVNAAMLAARYNPEFGNMQLVGYYNVDGARLPASNLINIPYGVEVKGSVSKIWRQGRYEIEIIDPVTGIKHRSHKQSNIIFPVAKKIGPWFGSNRKAPNGGMEMYVKTKIKR